MRLLQLNLWNLNEPLAERMRILERGVRDLVPDVITFQEVSPVEGRPQYAAMAERLGYHAFYGDSRPADRRREGNAVLSRVPAATCETRRLPHPEFDPARVAICCGFDGLLDRRVHVVSTHLAHQRGADADAARRAQARVVGDLIRSVGATDSFVLGADLNSDPGSDATEEILALPGSVDAWVVAGDGGVGLTASGDNPWVDKPPGTGRRIDYVIVGATLRVTSCQIVFTGAETGVASDHYGLLVEVTTD